MTRFNLKLCEHVLKDGTLRKDKELVINHKIFNWHTIGNYTVKCEKPLLLSKFNAKDVYVCQGFCNGSPSDRETNKDAIYAIQRSTYNEQYKTAVSVNKHILSTSFMVYIDECETKIMVSFDTFTNTFSVSLPAMRPCEITIDVILSILKKKINTVFTYTGIDF